MSVLKFQISASCYIFQTSVFSFQILHFNVRFSAVKFNASEFSFDLRAFIFHLSVYRFQLSDLNLHICCWVNQAPETGGTRLRRLSEGGHKAGESLERYRGNPPGPHAALSLRLGNHKRGYRETLRGHTWPPVLSCCIRTL